MTRVAVWFYDGEPWGLGETVDEAREAASRLSRQVAFCAEGIVPAYDEDAVITDGHACTFVLNGDDDGDFLAWLTAQCDVGLLETLEGEPVYDDDGRPV